MKRSMKSANEIFNNKSLPAREQVTTWYKIKETIGNSVHGKFLGWWITPPSQKVDKQQVSMAIEIENGEVYGISLSDTPYMRQRLEISIPGDEVGVRYEGDKDTGKPQAAKIVKFYNPDAEDRRLKGDEKKSEPEATTTVQAETPVEDEPEEDLGF